MKTFSRVKSSLYNFVLVVFLASITFQLTTSAQEELLDPIIESAKSFGAVVNTATVLAVSLVFLFFFYNLAKYILNPEEGTNKDGIKKKMGYALLAIVVITSLWGLVAFIRAIFGIPETENAGTVVTGRAGYEGVRGVQR